MSEALVLERLVKTYRDTCALDDVSFDVDSGQALSLLGPNGAGKTTLVRLLTTLERPDSGRAFIHGHDVVRRPRAVRSLISVVGQETTLESQLTGRESLTFHARLWGYSGSAARRHVEEMLELLDLGDAADRLVRRYSGGMRRRLDLGCSLVGRPPVLFLDEPTVGLDPVSRHQIWAVIEDRLATGTTVFIATQQLDEAERLCHRVCLLDQGRVARLGTPEELKADLPGDHLEITVEDPQRLDTAAAAIERVAGTVADRQTDRSTASVITPNGARLVPELIRALHTADITVVEVTMRRPTLEDAFLALAGPGGDLR